MSHIIPTLACTLILTVSLWHSHANPLPQVTRTGEVPRRTNHKGPVEDCSNEKQHPNINITSSEGTILRKVNSTYKFLKNHNPEMTLTCYTTYPIEWVFKEMLSSEGIDIRERREWITSEDIKLQQQRYVSDFSFNLNSKIKNVTCRAATESKQCKQTTVKFNRTDYNGSKATIVQVHRGFPPGKLLQQYFDPEEGNNINCSIRLLYNPEKEQFECSSLEHTDGEKVSWQLQDSDKYNRELCYDPFSCGLLYNNQATGQCKQKPKGMDLHATHSPFDSNFFSGLVTCKPSSAVEGESRSELSTSATSHYFRPLPDLCNKASRGGGFESRKIYVDQDPLSLTPDERSDFISFCKFNENLYTGDIRELSCITSLYLFAEGLQMKIIHRNGIARNVTNITLVNGDNLKEIKKDGYRNYTAEVNINSVDISGIECSAPLRKNKNWHAKEISLTVLSPINLTMEGKGKETVEVAEGEDATLRCKATAEPKPKYEWTYPTTTDKIIPNSWIHVNHADGSSTLTIPAQKVTDENIVLCTAINRLSSIRKTFTLKFPAATGFPWVAIIIPIVVIAVGCVIGFLVWKIIRQKRKLRLLSQAEIDEFMHGRPDVLLNTRSNSQYDVNSYAMCLPYNKNYEVLKEQLEIDVNAVIGSGAYGMVLKGILTNKAMERVPVAIKTLKPMDDISYFKALMSELKIMGFIGKHNNIINLLGAYTKNLQNREIFIAIEFCENGCMLNYMRNHRSAFINHVVNGTLQENLTRASFSTHQNLLNTITLMRWSMQIANGMDFLYHKKVIHGDLAARNILLCKNLTAKIGDFGLSRQLFEYANYIKKQQSPLPWKWLAIECLQDMKFSSQSDVWAYGITLWEVFSLGHSPYPGCTYNEEYIDSLVGGKRPTRPQYATKEVYNVMTKCWNNTPSDRPSFSEITTFFDNTIRSVTPEDYMELECTSDTNLLLPVKMDGPRMSTNSTSDDSDGAPVKMEVNQSGRNSKFRVSFKSLKF